MFTEGCPQVNEQIIQPICIVGLPHTSKKDWSTSQQERRPRSCGSEPEPDTKEYIPCGAVCLKFSTMQIRLQRQGDQRLSRDWESRVDCEGTRGEAWAERLRERLCRIRSCEDPWNGPSFRSFGPRTPGSSRKPTD